ncbi:MAG TPA: WbqC family protein [Bacteroidales bacterium]|jgi:hypothetical protein|nr:WbqC family protein [Bacteroidales bacterium]MDD4234582.1 WbqC family protein [Bacteroidales bacterium]MDY0159872.1 WbqC family protein [Bacteroidales bacterium]HXK82441.1 WbqC family protein [Bacteroidales bacterium]
MECILLSTAVLPNIQYLSKLLKYKTVFVEANENFPKQTYRNRFEIATANGYMSLSIPVVAARVHKVPIRKVLIDYSENWQQKHINAITSAYKNAPFFQYYADEIFTVFCDKTDKLFDFNMNLTQTLIRLIGFNKEVRCTDSFVKDTGCDDYRFKINPKKKSMNPDGNFRIVKYYQVFEDKHGFIPNLSSIDLLFNEGPLAYSILKQSCK